MPSFISQPSYDTDASTFFTTASITNTTGKQQISRFVIGIKYLGLWGNMVCWPLRSEQNRGSGTTAYSLGGYATYNATLTNGPTWSSSGIVFNNTSKQLDLTYSSSMLSLLSSYSVFYSTSTAANQHHFRLDNGSASGYYLYHKFDGQAGFGSAGVYGNTTRNSSSGNPNQNQSRSINLTTFQSSAYSIGNTSDTTYQDGSLAVSGFQTGLPARNPSGTPSATMALNSLSRTHAFQAVFNLTLTDSQNSQLNSLYKTTLGLGLDLP